MAGRWDKAREHKRDYSFLKVGDKRLKGLVLLLGIVKIYLNLVFEIKVKPLTLISNAKWLWFQTRGYTITINDCMHFIVMLKLPIKIAITINYNEIMV